jgi:hypothetical protein
MASDAAMATMNMGAGNGTTSRPGSSGPHGIPCDKQVPAATCQLMGPCAVTAAAVASPVANGDSPRPSARVSFALAIPASRSIAPELPPPRA